MGVNFLERQVLRRGHQLRRVPQPEYGTDAQMHHWTPETREPEKGFIEFQVKATESLHFVENNKSVTCRVKMADLHFWHHVIDQPVVLVLYDAEKHRAFWIDIQEYVEQGREFEEDQDEAIIRIPVDNKLTVQAVDKFRRMSLDRIARLRNPRP
jgi:hypothetical protein